MSSNGREREGRNAGSGGTGAGASRFDRALRDWPEASASSEGEGKARLERVVARIEAIDAGADGEDSKSTPSDDELFGSPLPRSAEDAEAPTTGAASSRKRLRERQNLKDLAKLARSKEFDARAEGEAETPTSHRAGEARGDDSGIIHLAAAAKSEPVAVAKPRPASEAKPALEPAQAAEKTAAAEPMERPRRTRAGMVVALYATTTVALASAAAAVFLFVRTREAVPVTVATAPPRTTETAAPEPPTTETPAPLPSASTLALGTDPNSLPPATAPAAPRPLGKTAASASEPASPNVEARPLASVAARDGRSTDLGSAIQREVGSDTRPRDTRPRDTQEKTPAAAITGAGDVPQRPSQGAITGAIGGVLPDARRCLGPDDPVSHAAILFASSGSVQSVTVSGPASGKPTETCIKDALSKAKVPPFAEPTSTANITIRHL